MSTITMPEPKKKTKNKKQNNTSEKKNEYVGLYAKIQRKTLNKGIR